jgi:hypothetical protein
MGHDFELARPRRGGDDEIVFAGSIGIEEISESTNSSRRSRRFASASSTPTSNSAIQGGAAGLKRRPENRDRCAMALDHHRLPLGLDQIEQLREPSRCLGCAHTPHENQII